MTVWILKQLKNQGGFVTRCNEKVEVFSRVVGYFRPVSRWNDGKKEEFKERKTFKTSQLVNK